RDPVGLEAHALRDLGAVAQRRNRDAVALRVVLEAVIRAGDPAGLGDVPGEPADARQPRTQLRALVCAAILHADDAAGRVAEQHEILAHPAEADRLPAGNILGSADRVPHVRNHGFSWAKVSSARGSTGRVAARFGGGVMSTGNT